MRPHHFRKKECNKAALALCLTLLVAAQSVAQPMNIPRRSYDRWMAELQDDIRDKTPAEIPLPGAHDAGTYGINAGSTIYLDSVGGIPGLYFVTAFPEEPLLSDLRPALVDWSKAQSRTIAQQLSDGIRYFDLRFVRHPNNMELFVIHHLALGPVDDDIFGQIEAFVRTPGHEQEVVIIELSEWFNFDVLGHRAFAAKLQERFGDLLIRRQFGSFPTFDEIWTSGKQVLVIYEDVRLALGEDPIQVGNTTVDPQLFWESDSIQGSWLNKQVYQELMTGLVGELSVNCGPLEVRCEDAPGTGTRCCPWCCPQETLCDECRLFSPSATLTPDTKMVACDILDRLDYLSDTFFQYLGFLVVRAILNEYLDCDTIVEEYHSIHGIASQINEAVTRFFYDSWFYNINSVRQNLNIIAADWYQYSNLTGAVKEMARGWVPPTLFLAYSAGSQNRLLSSVYGDYFGAEVILPGAGNEGVSLAIHDHCLYEAWVAVNRRLYISGNCDRPWDSGAWTPALRIAAGQYPALAIPALASHAGCIFLAFSGSMHLTDPGLLITRNCVDPFETPWDTPVSIPGVMTGSGPALAEFNGCLYMAWRGPNEEVTGTGWSPPVTTLPGRLYVSRNCGDPIETPWDTPQDLGVRSFSGPALVASEGALLITFRLNADPRDEDPQENHLAIGLSFNGQQWFIPFVYNATTEHGPALTKHGDRFYLAWVDEGNSTNVASASATAPLAFEQAIAVDAPISGTPSMVSLANNAPEALCAGVDTCADAVTCDADANVDNGSFDPDGQSITLSQNPSGPYGIGEHDVTLTVTDTSGEDDTCSAQVIVNDCTPPTITCPANVMIECDTSTDPAATGLASATDACDQNPLISYEDVESGSCTGEFLITRTWTASDDFGNDAPCDQAINVVDTTPPLVSCGGAFLVTYRELGDTPVSFTVSSTDNCCSQGVTITQVACTSEDCVVEAKGDTITIRATGPLHSEISWTVSTADCCGNTTEKTCSVDVVKPLYMIRRR